MVQHAVVKRDIIWDFVKGSNALSLKEPISDPKCYVYPSGTFAFAAGPPPLLTVSGPFAATAVGDFVTLEEVVPYHGGGE